MTLTPVLKIFLISTHFIPFLLIPIIMWSLNKRKNYFSEKMNSVFIYQLGLLSIIIALTSELLWHHFVQNWIYSNDIHILNMLLYFFMNIGFALMNLGIKRTKFLDESLLIASLITPLVYYFGIKEIIWVIQLIGLIAITVNARKVLKDNLVYLFPLFSFVVNMLFIMLLFQTDNAIYHIFHDIFGTLLGFAILGYAFWRNPKREQKTEKNTIN